MAIVCSYPAGEDCAPFSLEDGILFSPFVPLVAVLRLLQRDDWERTVFILPT